MGKVERMNELLKAAAPGGYDETLSSVAVYGPRGGLQTYREQPGTIRPGCAWVARAITLGGVRHGRHVYFQSGGPGRRSKAITGGPVLPDTPEVRAALAEGGWA